LDRRQYHESISVQHSHCKFSHFILHLQCILLRLIGFGSHISCIVHDFNSHSHVLKRYRGILTLD
jgi:hypothetical protein